VVICVAVIVRITAARPLKVTWVVPGSKSVPVIVTRVPAVPLVGLTLVIEGPKSTVKVCAAGVGSSLPARSIAFTWKVCVPTVSPLRVAVVARLNGVNVPPSRRQANWRLATGVRLSVPVKFKVAVGTLITPVGPPVIMVWGGVLSTMTLRVAVDVVPARSLAVAPSACVPSGTVAVSQVAVAVALGAGSVGVTVVASGWLSTVSVSVATPLPPSLPWAWTPTLKCT